ncbi:MAG: hypothetical protein Q9170_005011 [Blastenia crenularia]
MLPPLEPIESGPAYQGSGRSSVNANSLSTTTLPSRSIGSVPNSSFETSTTSPQQLPQPGSHQSDESWKELLLVKITTPTLFKDVLLRTLPWDGLAAYPINQHQLEDDIPVVTDGCKTYCLRPDLTALVHEPPPGVREPDTWYNQLFTRPNPHVQGPSTPFIYAHHAGDFFHPLGNLVECTCTDAGLYQERLTNYIWALNISTDPVSLWLVFDYVRYDTDGEPSQVELCKVYWNQHNEFHYHEAPYTYDNASLEGYLHPGGAWDAFKVFDDVDRDWQPEQVKRLDGESAERWLLGPSLRAYALHMPPKDSPGFRKGNVKDSKS